jgi:hypothetical protein
MPQNMRCGLEQRIGLFKGNVGIVALFCRSDEIQLLSHVCGFDVLSGPGLWRRTLLTDKNRDLSVISIANTARTQA